MITKRLQFQLGLLFAIVSFFSSATAHAAGRFLVNATINDQPVRFGVDTGSEAAVVLFRTAAERLGLRITNAPLDVHLKPGQVSVGKTEKCRLAINATNVVEIVCAVFDAPSYLPLDVDGLVGWPHIKENILKIDAAGLTLTSLDKVPKEAKKWTRIRLNSKSDILGLEIPGRGRQTITVDVDTGSDKGVALHPKKWHEWRATHSNQPVTLDASYMPGAGLVVSEVAWAKSLSFGPLELSDVPVIKANSTEVGLGGPRFEASLGLAALKGLDFIVDGKKGTAYLRPKTTPPAPYSHNRMGAVFVPRGLENDDLVARVAKSSPAAEAGIGQDDVLLKIGELDVTKWRTDPAVLPMSRFWEQSAGTRLDLTLKRGGEVFKTAVVLRDILSPDK